MTSNDDKIDKRNALDRINNPSKSNVSSDTLDDAKRASTDSGTVNRRSALKVVGGATASAIVPAGLVRAGEEELELIGISYDQYTHQAQKAAKASLTRGGDGGISGSLRVGGFDIPIGESSEPLKPNGSDSPHTEYSFGLDDPEFVRDGVGMDVRLTDYGYNFVGSLERPEGSYGTLAFTIGPRDEWFSPGAVRKTLFGGGDGAPDRPEKDLPKTGVPPRHYPTVPDEGGE